MTRFSTNQQEHVEIQDAYLKYTTTNHNNSNGSDNDNYNDNDNNNNNNNGWRWFTILQMVFPEANTSCQVDAVSGHVGLVLSILSGCKSPMVVPVVAKLNSTTKKQKKQKAIKRQVYSIQTHILSEKHEKK